MSIYCYLASRGDIFSIRAAGDAEYFIAMAVQLLGLWPKSVLKKMLLNRWLWQCVCGSSVREERGEREKERERETEREKRTVKIN